MKHGRYMLILLGLVLAMGVAMPDAAHAASASDIKCSAYVGVTNRVAGCIRDTMDLVSSNYFSAFYPMVSRIIAAFLTLVVAIYGVMAAGGMIEKVGRDTLMLLVKISLVGYFSMNCQLMYDYAMDGMDAAATVMVKANPTYGLADGNKDFSNLTCMQRMTDASVVNGKAPMGPWLAVDCLLDTVIGINIPANAGNADGISTTAVNANKWYNDKLKGNGMQRGMIYFFFSGMQTSVMGMLLAVIGFVFIWGLLTVIIKALMTYIAGYIGVTFMIIIAPLFIPLALFNHTKEYFEKWARLLISFALQPVMMLLFISFSIAAIDLTLYSGDYSVMYRIAGDASRTGDFSLNRYLQDKGAIEKKEVVAAYAKTGDVAADASSAMGTAATTAVNAIFPQALSGCDPKAPDATADCKKVMPIRGWHDSINWQKLADARVPAVVPEDGATQEQQISREVMAACIFCGIVIFVITKLMAVVPYVITDLVGDFGQTPNLGATVSSPWNQASAAMSRSMGGGVRDGLKTLSANIDKGLTDMMTKRTGTGGGT